MLSYLREITRTVTYINKFLLFNRVLNSVVVRRRTRNRKVGSKPSPWDMRITSLGKNTIVPQFTQDAPCVAAPYKVQYD